MRKLLLFFILAYASEIAQAYSFSAVNSDGVTIYYNILSSVDLTCEVTYKTTSYNSYSGSVEIPSSINYGGKEYNVTSIGKEAFYNCSSLTSITIPISVTSIGPSAFYKCSALTSIELPNMIKTIEKNAFWYCDNLQSIVLPATIRNISGSAFCYIKNPLSITVLTERPPVCVGNTGSSYAVNIFDDETFTNGVLNVPASAYNAYISISPWSKFKVINKIDDDSYNKCSAPEITFSDKTLSFSCATPQSQIHYSYYLGNMGSTESGGELVTLTNKSNSIIVMAYATAEGYEQSAAVIKSFPFDATVNDINGDNKITIADVTSLIDIIVNQ